MTSLRAGAICRGRAGPGALVAGRLNDRGPARAGGRRGRGATCSRARPSPGAGRGPLGALRSSTPSAATRDRRGGERGARLTVAGEGARPAWPAGLAFAGWRAATWAMPAAWTTCARALAEARAQGARTRASPCCQSQPRDGGAASMAARGARRCDREGLASTRSAAASTSSSTRVPRANSSRTRGDAGRLGRGARRGRGAGALLEAPITPDGFVTVRTMTSFLASRAARTRRRRPDRRTARGRASATSEYWLHDADPVRLRRGRTRRLATARAARLLGLASGPCPMPRGVRYAWCVCRRRCAIGAGGGRPALAERLARSSSRVQPHDQHVLGQRPQRSSPKRTGSTRRRRPASPTPPPAGTTSACPTRGAGAARPGALPGGARPSARGGSSRSPRPARSSRGLGEPALAETERCALDCSGGRGAR